MRTYSNDHNPDIDKIIILGKEDLRPDIPQSTFRSVANIDSTSFKSPSRDLFQMATMVIFISEKGYTKVLKNRGGDGGMVSNRI